MAGASVAIAWVHPAQATAQTAAMLEGAVLEVPSLWPLEVANALTVLVGQDLQSDSAKRVRPDTMMARAAALVALCTLSASCGLYHWTGIRLYYREAALPRSQIRLDIPYAGPSPTSRQRLNLFLPAADGAPERGRPAIPFVVFVHGGNWDGGDGNLEVGGADVYNNIGRYLASYGIGAAVISYRLLPDVTWQAQVADVATAVRWVRAHAKDYGGSSGCVFGSIDVLVPEIRSSRGTTRV